MGLCTAKLTVWKPRHLNFFPPLLSLILSSSSTHPHLWTSLWELEFTLLLLLYLQTLAIRRLSAYRCISVSCSVIPSLSPCPVCICPSVFSAFLYASNCSVFFKLSLNASVSLRFSQLRRLYLSHSISPAIFTSPCASPHLSTVLPSLFIHISFCLFSLIWLFLSISYSSLSSYPLPSIYLSNSLYFCPSRYIYLFLPIAVSNTLSSSYRSFFFGSFILDFCLILEFTLYLFCLYFFIYFLFFSLIFALKQLTRLDSISTARFWLKASSVMTVNL